MKKNKQRGGELVFMNWSKKRTEISKISNVSSFIRVPPKDSCYLIKLYLRNLAQLINYSRIVFIKSYYDFPKDYDDFDIFIDPNLIDFIHMSEFYSETDTDFGYIVISKSEDISQNKLINVIKGDSEYIESSIFRKIRVIDVSESTNHEVLKLTEKGKLSTLRCY